MKALTIFQPYAHMIAIGEKWVENRTWSTEHRGDIAIHVGRNREWLREGDEEEYPGMVYGAVIAIAHLYNCVPLVDLKKKITKESFAVLQHEHCEGPICWLLRNVRRIQPIFVNGERRLWEWKEREQNIIYIK